MSTIKQFALQIGLLAIFVTSVYAIDEKSIGIFNVVKFPNNVCNADSTNMNGTCYTREECASRDGTASGSCAEGYGVCCIITVACGGTTNENCTYLQQASSAAPSTDSPVLNRQCSFTICPQSTTVNRIKLDFGTFSIAPPAVPTALDGAAVGTNLMNSAIGQCVTDTFQAGNSPVICGENAGQHMILDTDGTSCVNAVFTWGLATQNRAYTIHIVQYESTNEMGGPPNCLQFFTGATGIVQTFNWQNTATSVHLANQNYNVCVRKMIDRCVICWSPETPYVLNPMSKGSFGVNNGASTVVAMGKSAVGHGNCLNRDGAADSTDYIIIPGGAAPGANNAEVIPGGDLNELQVTNVANLNSVYCGRYLNTVAAGIQDADATVCSRSVPFKLGVRFDGVEATGTAAVAAAAAKANVQETSIGEGASERPLGTMGFSLGFQQFTC